MPTKPVSLVRYHRNGMVAHIEYIPELNRWSTAAFPAETGAVHWLGSAHDFERAKQHADEEARCVNCSCPAWPDLPAE